MHISKDATALLNCGTQLAGAAVMYTVDKNAASFVQSSSPTGGCGSAHVLA